MAFPVIHQVQESMYVCMYVIEWIMFLLFQLIIDNSNLTTSTVRTYIRTHTYPLDGGGEIVVIGW